MASELRRQARALRAEQRAARRAEREVRARAKAQAVLARARARRAAALEQRPRRSDPYAAWLDERERRLPLLRADLRSGCDRLAECAVAAGGGLQALIEATGLRSRENALRLVDPAILVRAFDNDAAASATRAERAPLRRLVPDRELVDRRAAGEPLRRIAADYDVAHTTLSRWFARRQPRPKKRPRTHQPGQPSSNNADRAHEHQQESAHRSQPQTTPFQQQATDQAQATKTHRTRLRKPLLYPLSYGAPRAL